MVFVAADVHGAASDPRLAIEIRAATHEAVGSGIDAGRIGLEMKVTSDEVHQQGFIGDAAIGNIGLGAAIIKFRSDIIRAGWRGIVVENGVVTIGTAAAGNSTTVIRPNI